MAVFFTTIVFAQKKDPTCVGNVEGMVKDSVYNYVLQLATVSIYRTSDGSLINFQLTDNSGKFHFKKLPVDIALRVSISHVGYQTFLRNFMIPGKEKRSDLKILNMGRAENNLDEVKITAHRPPIQMRGDTLEFNAEAFKLDSNAVVEDLLRKLPGITVWSDGVITINGKPVKSVLVEGKPFFGGDAKIAIQNLPKNAIDKIQVYKDKGEKDSLNTGSNINIKLKKNMKNGMFGKVAIGYGTDNRFAADGMLSWFKSKTQFSVVASSNNVNKMANDVETLIKDSSFKGIGTNTDYQSDFRKAGLSNFSSGGFTYAHEVNKESDFNLDYFLSDIRTKASKNLQTIISLNNNSSLLQKDDIVTKNDEFNQKSNGRYNYNSDKKDIYLEYNLQNSIATNSLKQSAISVNNATNIGSESLTQEDNRDNITKLIIKAGYHNKASNSATKKEKDYSIDYVYDFTDSGNQLKKLINFTSTDNSQNQNFDRKYRDDDQDTKHTINTAFNDVLSVFTANTSLVQVDFKNTLTISNEHNNAFVQDFDPVGKLYIANNYLTNKSHYQTLDDQPGLSFSKRLLSVLDNRYQKELKINLSTQTQFYNQKNISDKTFQYIERGYTYFIPSMNIIYIDNQFGFYEHTYHLSYNTSVSFPQPDQLVPLIDSSNVWYLNRGNERLKPAYKHEISLSFSGVNTRIKNNFNYNFKLTGGVVENSVADSSQYDNQGRSVHYAVNVSGNKYVGLTGGLSKAYKFKENLVRVLFSGNLNYSRNPAYLNGTDVVSNNFNSSNTLLLDYTYKDLMGLSLSQSLRSLNIRQSIASIGNFKSLSQSTALSVSLNWPKGVNVSSNISYNRNTSTYSDVINYAIWNASLSYRFLKGNQAEMKFSALDLLHQNTSIINYGSGNSLTRGTVNTLQQYFLVTLAYFPRKFGNKK